MAETPQTPPTNEPQTPLGSAAAPKTEEEILAYLVGEPPVFDGVIVLHDYDAEWPRLYQREADRIRSVLGDRVVQLEHTGSTSVPGLAAKPIIDVLLVLADSSDEPAYVPDMEAAGYVLRVREPDWHQHRLFKGPDTNVNLHVLTVGSSEIVRMLAFRDHLRANGDDRELYERTKRELASRRWAYVQNYADAKGTVIEGIISKAEAAHTAPAVGSDVSRTSGP